MNESGHTPLQFPASAGGAVVSGGIIDEQTLKARASESQAGLYSVYSVPSGVQYICSLKLSGLQTQ